MHATLDSTQKELDELKATWLPELQQLVAKINENFRLVQRGSRVQ